VREHFHAGLDYQNKLARFLENQMSLAPHSAKSTARRGCIVARLSFSTEPVRWSMQRIRRTWCARWATDKALRQFYDGLLACHNRKSATANGDARLQPAWEELECGLFARECADETTCW
jgi:hypothetical protein